MSWRWGEWRCDVFHGCWSLGDDDMLCCVVIWPGFTRGFTPGFTPRFTLCVR